MDYTYAWTSAEQECLKRVDENGNVALIPASKGNSDYRQFLNSGAVAEPYVAPPEPEPLTTEEKVNHLLSDYGLTRDELRAVLDS